MRTVAAHVEIRRLTTAAAVKPLEGLQREVWAMDDWREVVPVHQLLTAALHGGILLGAYVDGNLVGFSYAFAGLEAGESVLCSHMLGVLPDYRRLHLGERLKWEQRRAALEQGTALVSWTYDPLETGNGALNLRRLGAVSHTYSENLYGTMDDGLNAGLPTDRLTVEWHLRSRRVTDRAAGQVPDHTAAAAAAGALSRPQRRDDGLLAPGADPLPPEPAQPAGYKLILPRPFQAVKLADAGLAQAWRLHVRQACQQCFAAGYWLTGIAWTADGAGAQYLFTLPDPAEEAEGRAR